MEPLAGSGDWVISVLPFAVGVDSTGALGVGEFDTTCVPDAGEVDLQPTLSNTIATATAPTPVLNALIFTAILLETSRISISPCRKATGGTSTSHMSGDAAGFLWGPPLVTTNTSPCGSIGLGGTEIHTILIIQPSLMTRGGA